MTQRHAIRRACVAGASLVAAAAVAIGTLTAPTTPAVAAPLGGVVQALDPISVDGMNLDAGGTAVINEFERTEVAPGLVHVRYERLEATGWQQINILKAEMGADTVRVGYLTPETVAGSGATVTEMVDGAGALAGTNLDRFDINNSWAAAGWGIQDGDIVKSGNPDAARSIVIDQNGLGSLTDLLLRGSATFGAQSVAITGVNVFAMPAGGVSLYNAQWGDFSRARALGTAGGIEVQVGADGRVLSVSDSVGSGRLPEGVQALVAATGTPAATALSSLSVGDAVEIAYEVDAGAIEVQEAAGAWHPILTDGVVQGHADAALHPRTMVGFSEDGRTAYFVQLDGRSAIARGMTLAEQGTFMKELGAHEATNVDGGGSSQMNVRRPGDSASTVMNSPSDGYERHDGDGMGLFLSQPGSGELAGFTVAPLRGDDGADRVFPGLRRTLVAKGHDEKLTAVAAGPQGWSTDGAVASVDNGVVTGIAPGAATVTASTGEAAGSTDLSVLGPLERITSDQTVANLEAQGSSTVLSITGHDARGFFAPIEASDIDVSNSSPEVFTVEPTEDGRFTVTATGSEGTATLVFTVGDQRVEVVVAVPLEVRVIDDFADVSGWTTAHDRAPTGSIELGEGHEGSPSIRLNYDFTESTGTRGRYAVAPGAVAGGTGGIDIPGRPQKLSVWIKGDGNGSLLRLQVMQANGVRNWIDGPDGSQSLHATWTGWERKDFIVPDTFEFPLKLERIRILETVAAKQYTGSMEFSKIYAYLPPEGVEAPSSERAEDPVVVDAGATDDEDLRVAVMSDAQFVARQPDSYQVTGARLALREIVAADPDVLLINGDLVDEASVADFDLAKTVLDEELAGVDFPWYYVPGNHEIMGASIDNFRSAFGDTSRVFDLDGTRFITTNSATGRLASDFSQVLMVREQLDAAASDEHVTGVVFVSHMPTTDPLPTKGSQLSDRNEAELVDDWLQEFREESGKSVAYVAGHVGVFHSSSVDGVPYVINGNSGKGPASTPADGGFTGWTMLGIDPDQGEWAGATESWLEVETKPRVDRDGLVLTAPERIVVGDQADVSAAFVQDAGHDERTVPVEWPVSSRWGGEGVHVGDAASAPDEALIAVDPDSDTVTALRAGSATIEVTVNGQTASHSVTIATRPFDIGDGEIVITGAPKVGTKLAATQLGWTTPEGAELTYQWLRNGDEIAGANGREYRATGKNLGAELSVRVTLTKEGYTTLVLESDPVEIRTGGGQ